jgi:hypothetical protein
MVPAGWKKKRYVKRLTTHGVESNSTVGLFFSLIAMWVSIDEDDDNAFVVVATTDD